jgi:hypothetical protein
VIRFASESVGTVCGFLNGSKEDVQNAASRTALVVSEGLSDLNFDHPLEIREQ